jgi:hypothetical protein
MEALMEQLTEKSKAEILSELRAITSNIRHRNETHVSNSSAKRTLAENAEKKSALIYRLARTTGYPEEDVVQHSQKISSWLKFGKIKGLPVSAKTSEHFDSSLSESWCFYLKGYENIHGVVLVEDVDGVERLVDVIFFLHGEG